MSIVLRYLAENQRWNVAGAIVYARERRLGEIIAASPRATRTRHRLHDRR